MRIRQIKPDFWGDELVSSWPAEIRLLYIGLWQEADDGGWMEWRIPRIGADLYPYVTRGRRERNLEHWSKVLRDAKRLMVHDCGHAYLPHLVRHQKFGGRPVHTVTSVHARDCARVRADDRPGTVEVGEGKERGGMGGSELPNLERIDRTLAERVRAKAKGRLA